ncbi:MAG: vanadium-dependent haloperoxidase [Candidatus Competibacteraceae bacterium]|jgi:hypothetical protein|nr:vanadium-dependent haloperoxidase [Candidatus Competibacteraceae bacterium]
MDNKDNTQESIQTSSPCPSLTSDNLLLSRRRFFQAAGGSGLLALTGGVGTVGVVAMPAVVKAEELGPLNISRRRYEEYWLRSQSARSHFFAGQPPQLCNDDEALYADKRANFSKCLPHNDLGEVDPAAYQSLNTALATGSPADFDAITLASEAGLNSGQRLANPQAAYAFEMTGIGSHATRIPPAPAFVSAEMAAEMAEVYWQALTRDVPHSDYLFDPQIAAAVDDLNRLSVIIGPTSNAQVTPDTLFRGMTPGDLIGPYVSQFLWLPIPYGMATIDQQYRFPSTGVDFMLDYDEWLAIQRGALPTAALQFQAAPRYILTNRDLGEYVHVDFPFQAFFNAALIMFNFGPEALALENPYRDSFTQDGFVTFGLPDINHLVTKAAGVAMKSAWHQKWLVHRRLRPEMYAGRIENQRLGNKNYGIAAELLDSAAVAQAVSRNGHALLPLAYPEGSPTHPAYPAGHAVFSGACATVLKALFNEDFVIPNPVRPTPDGTALEPLSDAVDLSLGGEINKLASNIPLARDAAGVHYRSDGSQGLLAGEQQAIGILQDYSKTYTEAFAGFTLTRFDGTPISIINGEVFQ